MRSKSTIRLSGLLAGLLGLAAAGAQGVPVPLGAVFRVSGCATCKQRHAAVAGTAAGAFAAAWEGTSPADPRGLFARFFTSNGAPRGADKLVTKDLAPEQYDAAVAADAAGNYLIAWSQVAAGNSEVWVQRFRGTGVPLGAPVLVNLDDPAAAPPPADLEPVVAATKGGGFVVAWIRIVPAGVGIPGSDPEVWTRRFGATGAPLGPPVRLSTGLPGGSRPDLCVDTADRAVVAWTTVDGFRPFEPNLEGATLRRVAANGAPLGAEVVVAKPLAEASDVAISCGLNGTFVAVWRSDQAPATDDADLLAQRYTTTGRRSGGVFRINGATAGDQSAPAISHDKAGNFVVVWQHRPETDGEAILGRRFLANGQPDGADFTVRLRADAEHLVPFDPDVAHIGAAGNFVVVWHEGGSDLFGLRWRPK